MLGAGGAVERQHSDCAREGKYDLGRSRTQLRGDAGHHRMAQHLQVGSKKRKALIDDVPLFAEAAHLAVPAEPGKTAVLYKCRAFSVARCYLLKVPQGDIAHAEETRSSCIALFDHRLPDFNV